MEQHSVHEEINLLDYCRVLWKRRQLIGVLCGTSMLVGLVYALLTPKIYQATATILTPIEVGAARNMALVPGLEGLDRLDKVMGGLGVGLGVSLTLPSTTQNTYVAILKSQTMRREVMDFFKQKWGSGVESLIQSVRISPPTAETLGTISLTVQSNDPKLAAEVANFYFDNLSTSLVRRQKGLLKLQLDYYERQLDRAKEEQKKAQRALIDFQEKNRYISLDPSTRNAINAGASLAGSVMALEMERTLKRMYLTDDHPEMIALDRRIYEAKRLLSHSFYGDPQPLPPEKPGSPPRMEYFVPVARMTPLQFQLAEVYRDLKFREAIWANISNSIESTRYNMENPVAIHVDWLDRAVVPKEPIKPKVSLYVTSGLLIGLLVSVFIAFVIEHFSRLRAQEVS